MQEEILNAEIEQEDSQEIIREEMEEVTQKIKSLEDKSSKKDKKKKKDKKDKYVNVRMKKST
ncbi:MAG: hypothetical protein J1D99_06695, partial [Campylobacter sp.]|nr:hypothetical protein [Campylobacter sp.]